jgi:hypothetical protein
MRPSGVKSQPAEAVSFNRRRHSGTQPAKVHLLWHIGAPRHLSPAAVALAPSRANQARVVGQDDGEPRRAVTVSPVAER